MKNYSLITVFLMFIYVVHGQKIHHEISMPNPETHYFHVQTELSGFKDKKLTLTMPVWSPGSYLIREYPQNVNQVKAKDESGNALNVRKVSKNKWEIDKGKAKKVTVNYEYYAFNLTVRTSFLDNTHGFFNGVNIFTYPEGYKNLGGTVKVIPHSSFKTISTPLKKTGDGFSSDSGATVYKFNDFDELADSPFEIGNQELFTFDAAGIKHTVAMYGFGNYDVEQLKIDMAKVVEASTEIFGQNPNKEYLFIIHNTDARGGGLEHMNSTTLHVNRWIYTEDYMSFLSLVAHEYFHVWNVKRLRPTVLVDFDYSNENYTDLLWVMEGFTSYYSELILRRAGFYTKEGYLNKLESTINLVEGSPGVKVQPVSHSSYDAWIKAYRPNENSRNTTTSYYSKGGLVASIMDAMVIEKYKGEKDLSDFLQLLYDKYYEKKNIGFTQDQFKDELAKYVGKNLDEFFEKYVDGTETLPYAEYYKVLGLEVDYLEQFAISMGMNTSMEDGKLIVKSVVAGSAAEQAGLSPNDEIIAFNGFRVNNSDLQSFLNMLDYGDEFNLIISRSKQLRSVDAKLGHVDKSRYYFTYTKNKLGEYWLRDMK